MKLLAGGLAVTNVANNTPAQENSMCSVAYRPLHLISKSLSGCSHTHGRGRCGRLSQSRRALLHHIDYNVGQQL